MKFILTVNIGSSSVKLDLYDQNLKEVKNMNFLHENDFTSLKNKLENFIQNLDIKKIIACHRVVHGGEMFTKKTFVNKSVLEKLKTLTPLAPLHEPYNIKGIEICKEIGINENYAFFDTQTFSHIPTDNKLFGVPFKKYHKFGFHGLNHAYILETIQKQKKENNLNGVIVHLGNGCSLSQVVNGNFTDTTMAYTPLAGTIMFSRSGDMDPGIVIELCKEFGIEETSTILNKKSGIKAIYKDAKNIKEVFDKRKNCKEANLAIEIFKNSIIKYLSYYLCVLEKVDFICFSGGVSENNPPFVQEIIDSIPLLKEKLPIHQIIKGNESLYMASQIKI